MVSSREVSATLRYNEEISNIDLVGVSTIHSPKPNTLSFTKAWGPDIQARTEGNPDTIFIVPSGVPHGPNLIPHDQPRLAYALVLKTHFRTHSSVGISSTAVIDPSANLAEDVTIGHFCVIEEGASIGPGTTIGHHTTIASHVSVGAEVSIGNHCSIGGPGFGFEHTEDGRPIRIEHLGSVDIEHRAEIGNHVIIARGTIESTRIGRHVMIDDAVFIAHNVVIGENTFIIAGAEISGSVTVGRDVWISPEAVVRNKISIGDRSLVGLGAVVVKDVPSNTIVAGVPAKAVGKRHDD